MADNKKYNVYRIINKRPGAKQNKKYYIISTITDENKLATIVRGMATSSTAEGGIKTVSKDMKAAGKDYRDDFDIKIVSKGASKHNATLLRNKLKAKTPPAKTYNTPRG